MTTADKETAPQEVLEMHPLALGGSVAMTWIEGATTFQVTARLSAGDAAKVAAYIRTLQETTH